MKKAASKLNSSRGASLIVAMLFFLICVMVASVIITAATVNAGRTEKQRDEQQVYLAVSSAAQLLQEDLAKLTLYEAQRVRTAHTCSYPADTGTDGVTAWNTTLASSGSVFADYVTQGALSICRGFSLWENTFSVTSGEAELADIPVNVDISMDGSYDIKCVISVDSDGHAPYSMTLSIAGTPEEASALDNSTFCTHLEDSDEKVLVNGTWEYVKVDRNYPINITTETITVTWSAGTLSKGG